MAEKTELELLKDRAKLMKITHHPNIGVEKLKEKINDALGIDPEEEKVEPKVVQKPKPTPIPAKSAATLKAEKNVRLRKEANRLVRIRVSCMNPNKKDWRGEIFQVSNRVIGTLKKFVPFDAEDGWHVPNAILIQIQERKYQQFKTVKLSNGKKGKKGFLVKEFSVEIMDPLTPEELKDLGNQQAMGNKID